MALSIDSKLTVLPPVQREPKTGNRLKCGLCTSQFNQSEIKKAFSFSYKSSNVIDHQTHIETSIVEGDVQVCRGR